jgi:hypothetical protein
MKMEVVTVPALRRDVDEILSKIGKISNQLTKLIVIVSVSGVASSPDVVRNLMGVQAQEATVGVSPSGDDVSGQFDGNDRNSGECLKWQ